MVATGHINGTQEKCEKLAKGHARLKQELKWAKSSELYLDQQYRSLSMDKLNVTDPQKRNQMTGAQRVLVMKRDAERRKIRKLEDKTQDYENDFYLSHCATVPGTELQ